MGQIRWPYDLFHLHHRAKWHHITTVILHKNLTDIASLAAKCLICLNKNSENLTILCEIIDINGTHISLQGCENIRHVHPEGSGLSPVNIKTNHRIVGRIGSIGPADSRIRICSCNKLIGVINKGVQISRKIILEPEIKATNRS